MSYMDHSATSPVDPEVLEAMLPYFKESFGNASTLYSLGREARTAMEKARKQVASLIGARAEEVYFTSGGTESDNLAIKGTISRLKGKGNHIITSAIEHPAVEETCKYLEKNGYTVTYLPVGEDGIVKMEDLKESTREDTILITIMHANNEIGTIQPIKEIGALAREKGILFHTDAVQSVGKIPVNVEDMNVDLLSISAHKLHGPKGVGALYIRKGVRIDPLFHGGGHERGVRPGTENIPGIVGLGKACQLAEENLDKNMEYVASLRDQLIKGVLGSIEQSFLNGHPTKRLPNNANFRFSSIEGESLILQLDSKGINASTGSACSSNKLEPSHVLMAIGLEEVDAHGSLRISLGKENTPEDIDSSIVVIKEVVERLRSMSPLWCPGGN
ncbi:cysteine desulfurase NifS [Methanobacterium sp. MZ-A1]|uniref:cysteine desulfurase NifS n=1 Tax=Methanobacterium sp. MZ-A1 TaxID=1911685 RepID=UPI000C2CF653|nr:cysteine desulfurase NifS [Methanobacterium sp. MZ-A1]AUB58636.1 cysteine desulfurase NifS [Methanobacterium sp. MZ-A1]MBW4257324.1 cysteine desulfurase NifS [Methanobacterium sp. YSL]PKL73435.1 MAG: cysteine desulfurase NifS [Methanobacteriales archaeon HGW-Methanobacteriales-2]